MDPRWQQVLEQLRCATSCLEAAGDENLPLLEDALTRCEAATAGMEVLGQPPAEAVETLNICLERIRKGSERIRVASACLRQEFARYAQVHGLVHSLAGGVTEEVPRVSCTG
jgi:hypothetical protein